MNAILNLFKLRIGVAIAIAALAGLAVQAGPAPTAWQVLAVTLAVLVSSSAAGAFNQYAERDLDARMKRTRDRPFVTGRLTHGPSWLWLIGAMMVGSFALAAWAGNFAAATYVFLGAFTYGVVYTVWLKRRTWWNIVVGGLAGSFAVLAGAAAVSPVPSAEALALGMPVVTLPGFHLPGRFTMGLYRELGIESCIARTPEEFIELSVRMATEPDHRRAVSAQIAERAGALFDRPDSGRILGEALLELAEARR